MKVKEINTKKSMTGVVNVDMHALIETCESLQRSGKAEEAALLYGQWLAEEQQALNPVVQFNYGALLQSLGHLSGAMAAYQNCLTLRPGFAQALINLGLACEKAGQEKEALQHWGQLVNQHLLQDDHDPDMVVMALNHLSLIHI